MKIGLYFGSFNPVHNGHLIIASHVANFTDIQQVWLVVSPQNPHKSSSSLLNEYHRLHLIRTAIEGENNLRVSNIEFGLPKPSYTADTLTYLREKYPQHEFCIIMGSDSFENLHKWKNFKHIIRSTKIYIYLRPDYPVSNTINANVEIVNAPLIEISSTRIRELIKNGKSFRYLVPDAVRDEIVNNSYYK